MNGSSIRRIQGVCFLLSHIPLAVVAFVLLSDGAEGDWGLIGMAFAATLVTAILLLTYLHKALNPALAHGAGDVSATAR